MVAAWDGFSSSDFREIGSSERILQCVEESNMPIFRDFVVQCKKVSQRQTPFLTRSGHRHLVRWKLYDGIAWNCLADQVRDTSACVV